LMLLRAPDGWSPYDYVILMSRRPFTEEEVVRAGSLGPEMGTYQAIALPGRPSDLATTVMAGGWRGVAEETRRTLPRLVPGLDAPNVAPATDESPYFFDVSFGAPAPLRRLLWTGLGLCAVVFVTGALTLRRHDAEAPARRRGLE